MEAFGDKIVALAIAAVAVSVPTMGSATAQKVNGSVGRLAAYFPESAELETALARSAAPASVSAKADVFAFSSSGYALVSKGSNGFACLVERSWAKDPGDPEFWNPKILSPTCMNRAAAQSILPAYLERTKWVLAGATEADVRDRIQRNFKTGKTASPQSGAMSYMMSKQQYLSDDGGHPWHPHVMFYFPASVDSGSWGANFEGSPVLSGVAKFDHVITFMVPVSHWSDGSPAVLVSHTDAHQQQ